MTDQADRRAALLRQRLARVADVSALTAEALKLAQARAGIEMETLRLELAIGRGEPAEELVRDLHDTGRKAEAIRSAQGDCEARIAAAEADVAEIDRLLAAAART